MTSVSGGTPNPAPVGWLSHVTLKGVDLPMCVCLEGREGNQVFVRQADPSDGEPARIPLYEHDQIVMMTPIVAVSLNLTEDVGRIDDLLTWVRVVPVRRDGNIVFGRTLKLSEPDDGRRVHLRPGDRFSIDEGDLVIELDAIDEKEMTSFATGEYVPITPVLWAWMSIGASHAEEKVRYLLAAARRLDAANFLLGDVERRRQALAQDGLAGPTIRRGLFGLISAVELAIVALGRVCDMIDKASTSIFSTAPVPLTIAAKRSAVNEIRNAYEHIEDRAMGKVFGKPHPDALTIFDHQALLRSDCITYGASSLNLTTEVPTLISEARQFLKNVASST